VENFLRISDAVQISWLNTPLIQLKDDYPGAFRPEDPGQQTHHTGMGTVPSAGQIQQSQQQGLLVRIAATHSGIITRNNGFYLPDKMRKGSATFLKDYPKPVLLHHEDEKDPIGRVALSDYVDTSDSITDNYDGLVVKNKKGKEIGTITEALIKDFVSDKMPFSQKIDVVRSLLMDSILNDNGYEGLGHIQLVANIVDEQAIKKLADGRYLTVSTGASTDAAICSVCRTDWTEDGLCEHKPGALYDGQKCFIIAGNLIYDEISIVNKPADRHARILELHYNGIKDSVQVADESRGKLYEVDIEFPQYSAENKKEEDMKGPKDTEDSVTTIEDPKSEIVVEDKAQESKDPVEVVQEDNQTTEEVVQDQTDEEKVQELPEDFLNRVLKDEDVKISDEDEERLYDMLWEEVLNSVKEGELALDAEMLEDAKLSTQRRKKLPKSTFCGPDRSFPVPDCAHVTAARRLIGRYKGPGNKSAILACVSRKAKAMGCGGSKDAVKDTIDPNSILDNVFSTLEGVDFDKQLGTILSHVKDLVGNDAFVQALRQNELIPEEQALLDEVVKHEETIGDLRDRLEASQKEYHLLFQDMETIQDALVEERSKARQETEKHLTVLLSLRDMKVEDRNFSTLSDSDLQSEISRTLEIVDLAKVVDKLDNGLSRNPTEEVENPVEIQDNIQKSKISKDDLERIEEVYWTIRIRDGSNPAEAFLQRMKAEGRLPQDGK
jgi:hypothetical protein